MMSMSATFEMFADHAGSAPGLVLSAPMRGQLEFELEHLKDRLLKPIVETVSNSKLVEELAWAANEAAALAWLTACPILVLPTLLEEKICAALKKWEKQEELRHQ